MTIEVKQTVCVLTADGAVIAVFYDQETADENLKLREEAVNREPENKILFELHPAPLLIDVEKEIGVGE